MYQAGKALRGVVVEAVKYDKDGIDIEFLNSTISKTVKVRPCYCELSASWPNFGGRRRVKLKSCSSKFNRVHRLHSADVWVISVVNISPAYNSQSLN